MTNDFLTRQQDIHARHKIAPERDLIFVLMLVMVFFLEYFAVICLLYDQFPAAAMLHAGSFALALFYAVLKKEASEDTRFAWMTVILLPLLGPVAAAGTLMALFWYAISRDKALSFLEWFRSIFPEQEKTIAQTVYERIAFGRDQSGERQSIPYLMDVMRLGSDEEKREILFKISIHYDACFAPVLRLASEDQSNVVRVLAATVIANIKNSYFTRTLELEKLKTEGIRKGFSAHRFLWERKKHKMEKDNHILLELARHNDNYAFSGVLDEEHEAQSREAALRYYREFIQEGSYSAAELAEARQAIGRLLLRMGRIDEACTHFEELRNEGIILPDMDLWYLEGLYRQRRRGELRDVALRNSAGFLVADALKYPDHIRDIILFWAEQPEVMTA